MYRVLTGNLGLRRLALVLVEHLVIVLSVVIAATVRLGWPETISEAMTNWVSRAIFAAVVLQLCLHYADLYDSRTLLDRRDLVTRLVRALGVTSVLLAFLYFWLPGLVIGRGVLALARVLIIALVAGWRFAFEWLSLRGR